MDYSAEDSAKKRLADSVRKGRHRLKAGVLELLD